MSMIPFLGMARQSGNHNKRSSGNKKTSNESSYGCSSKYTFKEYVCYLCLYDERVKQFFKKLNELGIKIDELDKEKYLESFVDVSNNYFEAQRKVISKLEELQNEGLRLSQDYRTKEHYYPFRTRKSMGFCGLEIAYDESNSFVSGFNGIRITEEMLLDAEKNPYEEEYKIWESQNTNILSEEKELNEIIIEKKKKLKFTLFKRKQRQEEVADLEKKLNELKLKIEEGKQKKDKATIFNNLTNSQRIKLLDYFKLVAKCETIGLKINEIINKVVLISTPYSFNNNSSKERDKWNRAFQLFLECKDFDVNTEMEYVNSLILEAFNKNSFSRGADDHSLNRVSNFMIYAVNWYISKLSSENKEKLDDKVDEIEKDQIKK